MRAVHWLFVVSVALFLSGIAFVIAAGRTAQNAAPVEEERPVFVPVASVKQIMAGITGPAATVVYNAVGTVINIEGVKEIEPKNDEEWAVVGNNAAALVESGNLMLMEGRAVDNGDWVTMSKALIEAATVAVKAAADKDKEGILTSGAAINTTCDNCHERYQRQ
jgi:hypothetical protein